MRATLLLADHAAVAEGKLYINGGGWSVTSPGAPSAIAIKLDVPWDRTEQRLELRLRLIGQDGEQVTVPAPDGSLQPVEISAEAQVGRPPGLAHGADVDFALAFQIGPLPLAPAQRYQWVLDIDGESREEWRLTFSTRPAVAPGPATYVVDP